MIIFYSWQSDLPNNLNRSFIEDALDRAVKRIRDDDTLSVEPRIDRDTSGVPGAPDITATILDKIDRADVFVADVSIVNYRADTRLTPNPNVLIELGYAVKSKGWNAVILVQNTAFGGPDSLPFDLRTKRALTYSYNAESANRGVERGALASALEKALRLIITEIEKQPIPPQEDVVGELMRYIKGKQQIDLSELLEKQSAEVREAVKRSALMNSSIAPTSEELVSRLEWANASVQELVRMFIAGAPWVQGEQILPLGHAIEELAQLDTVTVGRFFPAWRGFIRYPALRLLYAGGISALAKSNYAFLRHVFLKIKLPSDEYRKRTALIERLNAPTVFSDDLGKRLPGRERHHTPASDYLHESLWPYFAHLMPDENRYTIWFDRFEYLLALVCVAEELKTRELGIIVPMGSFMWRNHGALARVIQEELEEEGDNWPPLVNGIFPSAEVLQQAKTEVDKHIHAW